MKTTEQRFFEKVQKTESCWLWSGHISTYNGRGQLTLRGKKVTAHRASWLIHFGAIPQGMCVCHRCDNPPCVNPAHLFLGTQRDNIKDMISKGRAKFDRKSQATHCKHGHPYTAENTYRSPKFPTKRVCRTCVRVAALKYYHSLAMKEAAGK